MMAERIFVAYNLLMYLSESVNHSLSQEVGRLVVGESVSLSVSLPIIAECCYLLLSKYSFVAAFKRKMMIRFRTCQC